MELGVSLPNNWGVADPQEVIGVAELAEELGFGSVWAAEHMLNIGYLHERIGDRPYYHVLSILSFVAARTSTIRLGTSVVVLPFHHPVDLAKYAATLDQLSGGRLILGVGVGGMAAEFEALGLAFSDRGATTDESIAAMTAVWSSQPASHHGKRWDFSDIVLTPRTAQRAGVPLWSGGVGRAARRRAATTCAGWQPTGIGPDEFGAGVSDIRAMASATGRDPDTIQMSMRLNVEMDGSTLTTEAENRSVLPGDSESILAGVREFAAAGATHVVLAINTDRIGDLRDKLHQIATDVLPQYR